MVCDSEEVVIVDYRPAKDYERQVDRLNWITEEDKKHPKHKNQNMVYKYNITRETSSIPRSLHKNPLWSPLYHKNTHLVPSWKVRVFLRREDEQSKDNHRLRRENKKGENGREIQIVKECSYHGLEIY